MKILTHDSLKAAGGINRRIRELKKRTGEFDDSFIIIKLSNERAVRKNGLFREHDIILPKNIDQNFPYLGLESTEQAYQRFSSLVEELSSIVESEEPDVVLIMGTFFLPWSLLQCAKKYRLPVVHLYIGSAITEFYSPDGILPKIYKPLEREFIESSDHTIFNSQHCREKIKSLFNCLPKKYSVVWNGIPEEIFLGEPAEKREGFGYVARYDLFKNPKFLLDLDKLIRLQHAEVSFYVVSNLRQGIPDYHACIKAGFTVRPQISDDVELRNFYQSRIALIAPSRFETYGNVAVESLAAGVPCLVSSGMGASEVYRAIGLSDLIIDVNNLDSIVKKILQLQKEKSVIDKAKKLELHQLCSWDSAIKNYMYSIRGVVNGSI